MYKRQVLNAAARLVFRLRRYDHVTDALATLHWLRLLQRVDFKVVVMAFQVLHALAPPYLNQLAPSVSIVKQTAIATIPANNCRSTVISSRYITPLKLIVIRHPNILFSICLSSTS